MNKQEFLAELRKGLNGLPQADIEERLSFYSEMIDDRMEEGLSENEAVGAVGSVEDITAQILSEISIGKLAWEKVKPERRLKAWEIILIALGSPIWLSLLLAAVAVILAVYIVIWAVVIALWAVEAAFVGCSIGSIMAALMFFIQGNAITAVCIIGAGLLCAGFAILFAMVCRAVTRGVVLLTKKIALGIKSSLIRKEK